MQRQLQGKTNRCRRIGANATLKPPRLLYYDLQEYVRTNVRYQWRSRIETNTKRRVYCYAYYRLPPPSAFVVVWRHRVKGRNNDNYSRHRLFSVAALLQFIRNK
jgi:hypothetical protein